MPDATDILAVMQKHLESLEDRLAQFERALDMAIRRNKFLEDRLREAQLNIDELASRFRVGE